MWLTVLSLSLTFGVVGRTSHGFDFGPMYFLWFLIRKERKEKYQCVKGEKHLHVCKILAEKASGPIPILKKVGDPTLEVLADYFPLGFSAGECCKVSSQPGKWLTFYQVAEWSNSSINRGFNSVYSGERWNVGSAFHVLCKVPLCIGVCKQPHTGAFSCCLGLNVDLNAGGGSFRGTAGGIQKKQEDKKEDKKKRKQKRKKNSKEKKEKNIFYRAVPDSNQGHRRRRGVYTRLAHFASKWSTLISPESLYFLNYRLSYPLTPLAPPHEHAYTTNAPTALLAAPRGSRECVHCQGSFNIRQTTHRKHGAPC